MSTDVKPEAEPEAEDDAPQFVFNPKTKTVFLYHKMLAKKVASNALVVCDEDGKPV